MPYHISGQLHEFCSCKMLCPCWFGSAEPDQGWCSGFWAFEIERGESDGVELGGTRVGWDVDLPGDFVSGNGTARLYIDEEATPDQRRELEAIFTGERGGVWGDLMELVVTEWAPTQIAPIKIEWGERPAITVADFGGIDSERLTDGRGDTTRVVGSAAATGELDIESIDLYRTDNSRWGDPAMRRWESGGSGVIARFDWHG
jgi:hypothetical protein